MIVTTVNPEALYTPATCRQCFKPIENLFVAPGATALCYECDRKFGIGFTTLEEKLRSLGYTKVSDSNDPAPHP